MSASDAPEQFIEVARNARGFAIAPYSRFRVGAALEATDGRIFTGCNVENATYGLTMCAERVAILKALSEGARSFRRLVVVADTEELITPCGACRQIIWEFCGDITVVLANERGQSETLQMRDLLPRPFDAGYLKDAP